MDKTKYLSNAKYNSSVQLILELQSKSRSSMIPRVTIFPSPYIITLPVKVKLQHYAPYLFMLK